MPLDKPLIAIVRPEAVEGEDPTDVFHSQLTRAGYLALVYIGADQAKRALLAQKHDVVIVIDEVAPDAHDDAFIPWLRELPFQPVIFRVADLPPRWERGRNLSKEEWYDEVDLSYGSDMQLRKTAHPTELLQFVRRVLHNASLG